MDAGPDLLTLEQIGKYNAMCERGEITKEKMEFYKHNACPSCGACSFMGTASTMQVMAEALGLMLPGSALMPATSKDLREFAKKAGKQAVWLAEHNLTQFPVLPILCYIFRQLPRNLELRLTEIHLTVCTEAHTICSTSVRQENGRHSSSIMQEGFRRSWKRSRICCIWML